MSFETAKQPRIFLVDDHIMVREGLVAVLTQAGFVICGQAGTIEETLNHRDLALADLVIVDLSLGEDKGLELIKLLRNQNVPLLVYSMYEDSNIVRNAFAAGALGYVTKREVASCLVEAIRSLLSGKQYISPRAGIGLVEQQVGPCYKDLPTEFSDRQQRVYELLGEGLSAEEIAKLMGVSPRTVESYSARMIEKMKVTGMKELRRHAISARVGRQSS